MRLFGFSYSPFVVKVRKCLELKGLAFTYGEVPYLDRREVLALTGGSIHVPVLEDGGTVVSDSARITAWLDARYDPSLRADPLAVLVEAWADNVLEDTAFRIACPCIEPRLGELFGGREDARAVWRLLKERKFGPGCMEAWTREAEALNGRAVELLEPVARAVASRPFLLGDAPSLADAAVFGQLFFLEFSQPGWIRLHAPGLTGWFDRVTGSRA
jgi:glutathione S-transferase